MNLRATLPARFVPQQIGPGNRPLDGRFPVLKRPPCHTLAIRFPDVSHPTLDFPPKIPHLPAVPKARAA